MTSLVTTQQEEAGRALVRPLNVLVPLIQEDLKKGDQAAQAAGMPFYRAAGEKLIEARRSGGMTLKEMADWSKRNFGIGRSQTLLYVSLVIATSSLSAATEFSSLKDFRRRELGHDVPTNGGGVRQPSWQEPVKDIINKVDTETLNRRKAEMSRVEERDAERKLAIQLIDIGFKTLATKLHPDKGGSRDAMARLNRVRDRLKSHA